MRTQAERDFDLQSGRELERKDAEIDRLRAAERKAAADSLTVAEENIKLRRALRQAVEYADVSSLEDGMPEGKQATRLTATWIGKDIRYAAEFDVKAARILLGDIK